MSFQKALAWSVFWIGLSLMAALVIGRIYGGDYAEAFLTGYALEKVLSIDNLFIFLMVFSHFKVTPHAQRRVLNYGIVGVLLLRGVLIFAGIELVERFEWLMYLFGAIVVYTGFVMIFGSDEEDFDPETNRIIRWTRKLLPVADAYHGEKFLVRRDGQRFFTPLFVVLVVIEVTDVIFAVDSIPAIFSVTRDAFIIYSSNVLAVLGLRSLYFLLERLHSAFRFVKRGVGIILWFVGVKMILPLFWPQVTIDNSTSLLVILGVLTVSVVASVSIPQARPAHTRKK